MPVSAAIFAPGPRRHDRGGHGCAAGASENTAPFLQVAGLLEHCGVHVPRIDAVDVARGFVLLEDLGSE